MHTTQKTLEDLKDKLSSEDKESIEKGLKELREALSGDDMDKIKEKTDALSSTIQKVSTAIYQQAAASQQAAQQQQATSGGDGGQPSGDDKTIDAEYKVKDKKKKTDKKKY